MPPRRLSLALSVSALLLAFGCARAMAQTTPPPTPPPPTFLHDRDTDFYNAITEALGTLRDELERVDRWHIPLGDARRVGDARDRVDGVASELADPTLLDSIQPRDQEEVDRLKSDADSHAEPKPRPNDEEQWKKDGWNSWNLAMKWLTERLAEMAAKRAPAQPAEPEAAPAPTEERIGLRPQATLHGAEADQLVALWAAAEEDQYWKTMLGRTDLTDEQRKAAEKRARTAEAGLARVKERARKEHGGAEADRVEQLGRVEGERNGSAAEPAPSPPPAPAAEDLTEQGGGQGQQGAEGEGATTKDDQPAASLEQVSGDGLERDTPGLPTVAPTTTDDTDEEGGASTVPGGQVEQPQLKAGGDPDQHAVTDWFSGDDGLDGCLGKVRTSTIDGCGEIGGGTGGKLPPVDRGPEILPFPGFDEGRRGQEDGCKLGAIAAFSTCGLDNGHKPDIFTPGPTDLPGMTGCGPAGIMTICTGTGGDLGGSRVTTEPDLDLDRLFNSSGAPPTPLAPPPAQPGGASSLAA